ncbi:hypothetical protein XELAEV_18005023mg [Xenopus laevis]|uniref:Uncharacterized protein n=1 Tax=Xenopus laevis TaxID=8355 RepID=A0A974DXT3_XENLA|nr:hypothetical protein XELAEV_18005023mg [Xenopus laevis]
MSEHQNKEACGRHSVITGTLGLPLSFILLYIIYCCLEKSLYACLLHDWCIFITKGFNSNFPGETELSFL